MNSVLLLVIPLRLSNVMILKAIHAPEDREATNEKAKSVIKKLKKQMLPQVAKKIEDTIHETLQTI